MVTKWLSFLKNHKVWVPVVVFIAPLLAIAYVFFLIQEGALLNEKMGFLEKRVKALIEIKTQKENFVREFGSSDPMFLQNYVETISLLKEDVELLSKLVKHSSYEPIQKRLSFLMGGENKIQFVQGALRTSDDYVETEWKLAHPVEVGPKDVRQILSLVEGAPFRPQFMIKNFSLIASEESFKLDLEILQRNCYAKN